MLKETDRIQSFSVKPTDTGAWEEILKLREYSKTKGISFSFLIIQAITKLNKELKLNGK
jgi:hypothetical protein